MMYPHLHIILYVRCQQRSTDFYARFLRKSPVLNVPGMTEFELADNMILGLMPEDGIHKILGATMPHPASANGVPRCELYLYCNDVLTEYAHAIDCGAVSISAPDKRDWGHFVAYLSDPDGHILAISEKLN